MPSLCGCFLIDCVRVCAGLGMCLLEEDDECLYDMQRAAELRIVLKEAEAALSSRHTNLGSGSGGWSSS